MKRNPWPWIGIIMLLILAGSCAWLALLQPTEPEDYPTPDIGSPTPSATFTPTPIDTAVPPPATPPPPFATGTAVFTPSPSVAPTIAPTLATMPEATTTPLPTETLTVGPTASPEATGTVCPTSHTVIAGNHLWNIALRYYGNGRRWVDIYAANQHKIRNPHLIYSGQVFALPGVCP